MVLCPVTFFECFHFFCEFYKVLKQKKLKSPNFCEISGKISVWVQNIWHIWFWLKYLVTDIISGNCQLCTQYNINVTNLIQLLSIIKTMPSSRKQGKGFVLYHFGN